MRLGLTECINHGLLHPYPVMHEKGGELVAQVGARVSLGGGHVGWRRWARGCVWGACGVTLEWCVGPRQATACSAVCKGGGWPCVIRSCHVASEALSTS